MRIHPAAFVVLATGLLLAHASSSWALRCGNRVVSIGDTRYEVLSKCGEPSFVEERDEEQLRSSTRESYLYDPVERKFIRPLVIERIIIEEWIYNFGPHSLIYYVRFENGVVDRIRTGNYGF